MRTGCLIVLMVAAGCPQEPASPKPASPKPAPGQPAASKVEARWEKAFQGVWVVESSSGKPDSGHLFVDGVDKEVLIKGDLLFVEHMGKRISKKLVPRPDVAPGAFDLKPDKPKWKTWSRVAIMKVAEEKLTICVNFPQGPRPKRFKAANDGRECVVLKRRSSGGR